MKKAASLMVYCGERSLRGKGEGGGGSGRLSKELAKNWQGIGGVGDESSNDMYRVKYSNESFVVSN